MGRTKSTKNYQEFTLRIQTEELAKLFETALANQPELNKNQIANEALQIRLSVMLGQQTLPPILDIINTSFAKVLDEKLRSSTYEVTKSLKLLFIKTLVNESLGNLTVNILEKLNENVISKEDINAGYYSVMPEIVQKKEQELYEQLENPSRNYKDIKKTKK